MAIEVELKQVSKRFKRDWIIQHVDYTFASGDNTAVLGANGSGKSTLLKILCGYMATTEGEIIWRNDGQEIDPASWHHFFAYTAPYLELIEEYTLQECLDFHFSLKSLRTDIDLEEWLEESGLSKHKSKQVQNFSSGMKQRLKLILTLGSNVQIYFLDEPCSNLDESGIQWYQQLISTLSLDKTIVVASNSHDEYAFCDKTISAN